jgi:hypothetical protein
MQKVIGIVALAVALLGSTSFVLAQTTPDLGANTGSESNRQEHQQGGVYSGSGR